MSHVTKKTCDQVNHMSLPSFLCGVARQPWNFWENAMLWRDVKPFFPVFLGNAVFENSKMSTGSSNIERCWNAPTWRNCFGLLIRGTQLPNRSSETYRTACRIEGKFYNIYAPENQAYLLFTKFNTKFFSSIKRLNWSHTHNTHLQGAAADIRK